MGGARGKVRRVEPGSLAEAAQEHIETTVVPDVPDSPPGGASTPPAMPVAAVETPEVARGVDTGPPLGPELSPPPRPTTPESNRKTVLLDLPSRGIPYGGVLDGGTIEIATMTIGVEKAIAGTGRGGGMGSIIETLLSKCVVTDVISPDDYLISDAFYVMMMIRAHSYGTDYTIQFNCSECGSKNTKELNILKDMQITYLDPEDPEPWAIELPESGDVIEFRSLTRKDEKAIQERLRQLEAKGRLKDNEDASYTMRLARRITAVGGEPVNPAVIEDYLEALPALDGVAMRVAFEEMDCGIDTTLHINCSSCRFMNEEEFPLTGEFFVPAMYELNGLRDAQFDLCYYAGFDWASTEQMDSTDFRHCLDRLKKLHDDKVYRTFYNLQLDPEKVKKS